MHLLTSRDRRGGARIIALMVVNALLDFFSLASFLPIIFFLVDPGFISSNKYAAAFYNTLKIASPSVFVIAFTAGVLVFIILKNIVSHWITRSKANYCFFLGSDLSSRMLSQYLQINYLRFAQVDFSKELNRIANLPIAFANNIIMPMANLLSEGLVFTILLF
ncbi:MAG TPA: hypothetical protein VKQ08_10590, partial [Cyclobacteriaceae bacterium]|nr:hypothetical protein [Cyclobacteriaceae bacterium]